MTTYQVSQADAGMRIDQWLVKCLETRSRSQIKLLIDRGEVLLNKATCKAGALVYEHDVVTVQEMQHEVLPYLTPVKVDFTILYEDDDLIVIDKPAGISVHPGAGSPTPTIVHGLLYHCKIERGAQVEVFRPGIVHRLDKDTSGVMVCAKTEEAHHKLALQFAKKTNKRLYTALLDGVPSKPVLLHESFLARHPTNRLKFTSLPRNEFEARGQPKQWRWSKSKFTVKDNFAHRFALAEVELFTGRTHQIRIHALDLKTPVVGDPLYGRHRDLPKIFLGDVEKAYRLINRQLLHAHLLGFKHPRSEKWLEFSASVPDDFRSFIQLLDKFKITEPSQMKMS